jgi:hypothetical protein
MDFTYPWYYYPLFICIGAALKVGVRYIRGQPLVRPRGQKITAKQE